MAAGMQVAVPLGLVDKVEEVKEETLKTAVAVMAVMVLLAYPILRCIGVV